MIYLDRALPQHGVVEPHGCGDGAVVGEFKHAGPEEVVEYNFSNQTIYGNNLKTP